jgi:DNA sulfur modification protein DndE
LIQLKRVTGIQHWNELCRWALCLALSGNEEWTRLNDGNEADNITISWTTFAGEYSEVLNAMVRYKWQQMREDHDDIDLPDYLTRAIEHGIAVLPRALQETAEKNLCALPGCPPQAN